MKNKKSIILWFTGLSGSGKTTLSNRISKFLKDKNFKCIKLDGDKFRNKKKYKDNFSKQGIKKNNFLIIREIKKFNDSYDFIIVSVISPLRSTREYAKKVFDKNYIEIFVKCTLKELFKRDTKGLYRLARNNKIKNLIGFNSNIKYEKTSYKKIIVNTKIFNIKNSLKKIIKDLDKKFNIKI